MSGRITNSERIKVTYMRIVFECTRCRALGHAPMRQHGVYQMPKGWRLIMTCETKTDKPVCDKCIVEMNCTAHDWAPLRVSWMTMQCKRCGTQRAAHMGTT